MELTPQQAAREWKAGRFGPVYLLIGEDASGKARFIAGIKEILKPDPFNLDDFAGDANMEAGAAVAAALSPPMMAPRRLVVLRGPRLGVDARKRLAAYLADPLETTTLVLVSEDPKADPRDALCGAAAALGGLVCLRPLRETEAAERLREEASKAGVSLSEETAASVVSEAGTEWGVLAAELEKMLLFARGRKELPREDALACLGYRRAVHPFALSDAVVARDAAAILDILRRLRDEGEDAFHSLGTLRRALRQQLWAKRMLRSGVGEQEIKRRLRCYGQGFFPRTARVTESSVRTALRGLLRLEARLKRESWLNRDQELERLLTRICSGRPAPASRS